MSYNYPPNNQVDFSWVGFENYTYPESTTADLAWYTYACHYLENIPSSPNINFALDEPVFYPVPPGSQVDFFLVCDVKDVETVLVQGEYSFEPITIQSEIHHWPNTWFISGATTLESIGSESFIAVTLICSGSSEFTIQSQSVIDRGNRIRSNTRIRSGITSEGYAEMTPVVLAANNTIGSNEISSTSGVIIVRVIELKNSISFSTGISHLRGRVLFGYPRAPIIKQVYEVSNSRSDQIVNFPEDVQYAVYMPTTDLNLTDEVLRRGTVDLAFEFTHDLIDIERISVWVMTAEGNAVKDQMKIFDYPGGNYDDHILQNPFSNTSSLRIPIHCISKKSNQFYIEVEYRNPSVDNNLDRNRDRVMLKEEKYIIPFQAHFDNRNPYVNIADHEFVNGPQTNNNTWYAEELEQILPIDLIPDGDSSNPGSHSNSNTWYVEELEELTKTFEVDNDPIEAVTLGSTVNIYFIKEYVDLTSTQIGG